MKRKIFFSMCILTLIIVLLSSALISGLMYKEFYERMKLQVKNEAALIASAMNLAGKDYLTSVPNAPDAGRITLIASDGTVLYDSDEAASSMENHLGRPEVAQALRDGSGESMRFSETMGLQTFYYAVRLENGTVLRAANTQSSVFRVLLGALPYMLMIAALIVLLATLLADYQTRRIVGPINALDLENPLNNVIYDEFTPLLTRIAKQNQEIEKQIAAYEEKQEELDTITESMQEGMIVLDAKANVLSINKSALRLFRIERKDSLHKHILTLHRSLPLQTAVEKALGGEACEEPLPLDGRHYQLLASPVKANGALKGVLLLILDVTEKLAAEEMRREFSANVSHELKTPLTSISGYAEIMKEGLVKPEDMQRFSARIYSEATRLIDLVEDIMELSRLDEGKAELPTQDVELLLLCRQVCDRLTAEAAQKGVSISVSGENAVVCGERRILDEIVYNLCTNAIKYNRENGRVDVSVHPTRTNVVLTVTDTGIGIAKEDQDRVFERFYRVDKSHSKETGGTGLGLSIVKHGVMFHGAKLSMESEPNQGTTVRIEFPLPVNRPVDSQRA